MLSWGWLPRWWWLRLILTFKSYVTAKIPPSNQGFYFFPELYAIIRSMPVVPMELTVSGVISFGWVRPHLGWPSHKFSCCTQCLKFPIYRQYIGYRSSSTRFLPSKIVQWKNRKKSENIDEISPIYRSLTDISVNLLALNDIRTWGKFLGIFSSIYRRYIENIGNISPIFISPIFSIYL